MAGITVQKCCLLGLLMLAPLAFIILQSCLDQSQLLAVAPAKLPENGKARMGQQVEKALKSKHQQKTSTGTREDIEGRKNEQEQIGEYNHVPRPGKSLHPNSDLQSLGGHSDRRTQSKETAVTHIGFVKTHKASSTTVMTMLFRFGLRRNLTFVLSTTGKNVFDYHHSGPLPIRPIPQGSQYDILCMHSVFNSKAYSQVLPADTVYIGTIREPVATFVSAVYYFESEAFLKSLMTEIRKHDAHFLRYNTLKQPRMGLFSFTRNHMAKDYGFTQAHLLDVNRFDKYLQFLDKKFRLVMVTERFDESLVLLKRYLNWDIRDIVYMSSNVGKKKRNFEILDSDRELIRAYNYLDYKVHRFFAKRLETQIAQEGSDFTKELTYFRSVLKRVSSFCGVCKDSDKRSLEIAMSEWNDIPFTVQCGVLQLKGPKFHKVMHLRHEKMFPSDSIKKRDRIINLLN